MPYTQPARNVAAFLDLIAWAEGTGQGVESYRVLYGHLPPRRVRLFDSLADHPRQAFETPWGYTSAAGRYQFMAAVPGKVSTDTWDRLARKLKLADFGPASQDAACIELLRERGALPLVEAGRVEEAIVKASWEWASLPPGRYGQPVRTMAECVRRWVELGGELAGTEEVEAAPAPAPQDVASSAGKDDSEGGQAPDVVDSGPPTDWPDAPLADLAGLSQAERDFLRQIDQQRQPVGAPPPADHQRLREAIGMEPKGLPAFLRGLATELVGLLPMFGVKPAALEKAGVAADTVARTLFDAARAAVPGAANEQAAVEVLRSDPAAQRRFQAEVATRWSDVAPFLQHDAAEREKARAFADKMTGEGPKWRQIGYAAGLALTTAAVIGVFAGLSIGLSFDSATPMTLREKILDQWQLLAAAAVFFWLGSSSSSRRKDDAEIDRRTAR